jgi:hypothetical protein
MSIKNKSKRSRRSRSRSNKKSNTRKMGGGSIGVRVESGSPNQYINPVNSAVNCPGCRSDNTTGTGAYSLNTPLPDFPPSWNKGLIMKGGGTCSGGTPGNPINGPCSQAPWQFSQKQNGGGGKSIKNGRVKGHGRGRGGRGMKGGNMINNFWSFMKTPFWSAGKGGDVLAPSTKGITISGLGSPVSTAANPPMPKHQPWPYQLKQMDHSYQMKGGGRSKTVKKGRGRRSLKGGNIINDIQNFGRGITYNLGKVYNDLSGYSNKIYAANPIPSFGQFPRGLSAPVYDKYTFNPPLQKIYNNADLYASKI